MEASAPTTGFGPSRFYVELELFERGMNAITALVGTDALRLLVAARGFLQFELREEGANVQETLHRHDLTVAQLEHVCRDVTDCLAALVYDNTADEFAEVRADPTRFDDGEVEDAETARVKFERVAGAFSAAELQARVWVKQTSGLRIPSGLHWDVLDKRATSSNRSVSVRPPARFGELKFVLESPERYTGQDEEFVMTVDKEDVGLMIDTLQAFMRALETDT